MIRQRLLFSTAVLSLALAACGGGTATQAPAATQPGGGGGGTATDTPIDTPTDAPVATQSGGGGGGGNTANGQAHFEVSGSESKSGDLGFLPIASRFGGMDGTILNFVTSDPNVTETLTVTVTNGQVAIIYASMDITVTAAECTTSNLDVGATTASGSFECTQTYTVLISGASIAGVILSGTFEARA